MTKQEEIREGVYRILSSDILDKRATIEVVYDIFSYLHSQDVVRKTGEKLPPIFDKDDNVITALEYKRKLIGCAVVESLTGGE